MSASVNASPLVSASNEDREATLVQRVRSVYQAMATQLEPSAAHVLLPPSPQAPSARLPEVMLIQTQRDLEGDAKREIVSFHRATASASAQVSSSSSSSSAAFTSHSTDTLLSSSFEYTSSPFPSQVQDVVASLPSPSGSFILIIRKAKAAAAASAAPAAAAEAQYSFEISDRKGRLLCAASSAGVHGRILTSGLMGSLQWHDSERLIVWIAEPSSASSRATSSSPASSSSSSASSTSSSTVSSTQPSPYFEPHSKRNSKSAENANVGSPFEWKEDYGEQMAGVRTPRPFFLLLPDFIFPSLSSSRHRFPVLSFGSVASVVALEGVPEGLSLGSIQFAPASASSSTPASSSDAVVEAVAVSWATSPRRMGISFYNTRPSTLQKLIITCSEEAAPSNSPSSSEHANAASTSGNSVSSSSPKSTSSTHKIKLSITSMHALTGSFDYSPIGPRFSCSGEHLVFTSTGRCSSHLASSRLRRIDWRRLQQKMGRVEHEDSEICTLINIVDRPKSVDSFPGFFPPAGLLATNCFLSSASSSHAPSPSTSAASSSSSSALSSSSPDEHLLCSTAWRHRERVLAINSRSGLFLELPLPLHLDSRLNDGSLSILAIKDNFVVLVASSFSRAPSVFLARLSFFPLLPASASAASPSPSVSATSVSNDEERLQIEWWRLTEPMQLLDSALQRKLDSLAVRLLRVQPANGKYCDLPFDAMLIHCQDDVSSSSSAASVSSSSPKPMHLFPHGGPHSSYTNSFSFACAFLCIALDHSLLMINYRGSTAYGQASLLSLPGLCGTQDVDDCWLAMQEAQRSLPQIVSQSLTGVLGGSHGGFLTCHLIGQKPGCFYSASTRNPVTNLVAMHSLTDIPDWTLYEALGEQDGGSDEDRYDAARTLSSSQIAALHRCSPIAHINHVSTPLLLMLGLSDKRVPPQPNFDYARILKAKGVDCRMLVYPDAQHGLNDSVSQEADVWCETALWMLRKMPTKDT